MTTPSDATPADAGKPADTPPPAGAPTDPFFAHIADKAREAYDWVMGAPPGVREGLARAFNGLFTKPDPDEDVVVTLDVAERVVVEVRARAKKSMATMRAAVLAYTVADAVSRFEGELAPVGGEWVCPPSAVYAPDAAAPPPPPGSFSSTGAPFPAPAYGGGESPTPVVPMPAPGSAPEAVPNTGDPLP